MVTLKLKATKFDFDRAISASRTLSDEGKSVRADIQEYMLKAENIMDSLATPTKEIFLRMFKFGTDLFCGNKKTNIEPFFQHKISRLFGEEKYSTSTCYRLALVSLHKYKPLICFEDIDEKFLKGYVLFNLSAGNTMTTASMYARCLCCIYAFEPDPKNFDFLEKKMLSTKNVFLNKKAVGARNETHNFFQSIGWSESGSLKKPTGHLEKYPHVKFSKEAIKVEVVTLDSYCKQNNINNVDFI
jgi:FkbM family methyltransferase